MSQFITFCVRAHSLPLNTISNVTLRRGEKTRDKDDKTSLKSKRPPVEVGAASHGVVCEMLLAFLISEVLQRVGPQQVAHGSVCWGLLESV